MWDQAEIKAPAHYHSAAKGEPAPEWSWTRPMETVARSLQARLGDAVDPERIRAEVAAEFAVHARARIRDFVPILVEKRVRAHLLPRPANAR